MQGGEGVIRTFGVAADTDRIKVDLPAFGKPSKPTSARTLSSRFKSRASPAVPGEAFRGDRLTELLK